MRIADGDGLKARDSETPIDASCRSSNDLIVDANSSVDRV